MTLIRSDFDHLEDSAAVFYASGDSATARDIRCAILDIQTLRDCNAKLERERLSPWGAALFVDGRIETAFHDSTQLASLDTRCGELEAELVALDTDSIDGLERLIDDRIAAAEMDTDRVGATNDAVRDMITAGEIIVSIDVA